MRRLAVLLLLCGSAFAQLAFEVASVKPSQPDTPGHMTGGPGTADPGRWTCTHCSLFALLTQAYAVFEYQLQIPDWTNSVFFDVVAKLPPGATRDEFRLMLQRLLAERFQMKAHHESREQSVYEVTVAKVGPKLHQVTEPIPAPPPGQPVVDATGLAGTYPLMLSWTATPRPDDVGPTLFQAVEDQLGLKLKPARAAIETIVVDHLEKTPSGN